MHLRLIEITNFRGIKYLELKLNVITGVFGEGSFGKTSLVQALNKCLGQNLDGNGLPCFYQEDFFRHINSDSEKLQDIEIKLVFRESSTGEWDDTRYDPIRKIICDWIGRRSQITMKVVAKHNQADGTIPVECIFFDPEDKPLKIHSTGQYLEQLRNLNPVLVLPPYDQLAEKVDEEIHFHSINRLPSIESEPSNLPKIEDDSLEEAFKLFRLALTSHQLISPEKLLNAFSSLSRSQNLIARLLNGQIANCKEVLKHYLKVQSSSTNYNQANFDQGFYYQFQFENSFHLQALLYVIIALDEALKNLPSQSNCQPIVAIENLESNTHPILLASIWGILAQTPAQKLMVTNSYDLLSSMPLASLRRIVSTIQGLEVHKTGSTTFSTDELRRIGYHLRGNRSDSIMARCWLLVEGESEFWLLPEMAFILGIDFKTEGIRCIEFAQCGLKPLIKLARALGIEWHVLVDGDQSGMAYANITRRMLHGEKESLRLTKIPELNIEHHLSKNGFKEIYIEAAGRSAGRKRSLGGLINHAVKRHPKPNLILAVVEMAQKRGRESVSPLIKHVIRTSLLLSRKQDNVY